MLKNFITVALRNIVKHKAFSLINIIGFSLGISCFLLIVFYVIDELSYDIFHKKADRIYRVAEIYTQSGNIQRIANSSGPWGPALKQEFPEVLDFVRLMPPVTEYVVSSVEKDLHFYEEHFVFADASVFDIFDFRLVSGNPATVLSQPNTVVLTESTAARYFGGEDPIGKTLVLDQTFSFKVTGVAEDVPRNSHLTFDFLASFISLDNRAMREYAPLLQFFLDRRGTIYTYILLQEGASATELEKKFPAFMEKYAGDLYRRLKTLNTLDPTLQALKSIHLHSHLEREWEPNGNIRHVLIFLAVAVFVLLIACFNFMNLSTARSALRAREVGLRKVVGAERPQIIRQFLSESVFMTALATVFALGITHLLMPLLNRLTAKEIHIGYLSDWRIIPGLILLVLLVGLISGSYPAFVISAFQPIRVLRGNIGPGMSGKRIRMILTVVQFTVSIGLIIGLLVVEGQMSFIRNKDLGYDKEHVVVLPLSNTAIRENYETYKDIILTRSGITAVSASNTIMGKPPVTREVRPADAGDEANMSFRLIESDIDFLRVYRMDIQQGRDFSLEMGDDKAGTVIINPGTARGLGLESPVGKVIHMIKPLQPRKVVGIVRSFHLESLHEAIQPVIISLGRTAPYRYLSIRISPGDVPATLDFLQQKWLEVFPGTPFEYSFFDQDFDALYRSEERLGRLFIYFTVLALSIACLGLFGLASFIAERRSKEIGIRKVVGASTLRIVILLLKEFALLVGVANGFAWPLAFLLMRSWLQDFAYRIPLHFVLFLTAGILVLLVALFTVSFQSVKAALTDPVHSLRYE